MAVQSLTLTADEREFLVEFLQEMLKETRVEEHRTDALSFRQRVQHREDVIAAILAKLGSSS